MERPRDLNLNGFGERERMDHQGGSNLLLISSCTCDGYISAMTHSRRDSTAVSRDRLTSSWI
jgi:hypothetical protein